MDSPKAQEIKIGAGEAGVVAVDRAKLGEDVGVEG